MRYLDQIKSKLAVEEAANLTDLEIQRCLGDCVCGHWLVPMAKKYRDAGELTMEVTGEVSKQIMLNF